MLRWAKAKRAKAKGQRGTWLVLDFAETVRAKDLAKGQGEAKRGRTEDAEEGYGFGVC